MEAADLCIPCIVVKLVILVAAPSFGYETMVVSLFYAMQGDNLLNVWPFHELDDFYLQKKKEKEN